MTTLSIDIPSHDPDDTDDDIQRITVTHFVFRKMSGPEMLTPFSAYPGILLLLPQADSFKLVIDGQPTLMAPGLVQVLSGNSDWTIEDSLSREDGEIADVSTVMIELNALINGAIPLRELLRLPVHLDPVPSQDIERLSQQFTHNQESLVLSPGGADIGKHLAAAKLVTMLLSTVGIERLRWGEKSWHVQLLRLKQFMVRNLSSSPSLECMARHMGMSRSSFYRWAKPLLGCSPVQYLRRLRLEKSQELLRNSSLSIDEIAVMTGFSSRYHLTKDFVKNYEITPARLRRAVRQETREDVIAAAEELIRERRFDEALVSCINNMKRPALIGSQDHIRDQRARCLYALGRIDEAVEIWEDLRGGPWAYPACKQLCNHYYRCGNYERASMMLGALYPEATRNQQRELVLIWCHQVAGLLAKHLSLPLRCYVDLRHECFPGDSRSMSLAADALIGLGQEHRVVEECPDLHERHLFTLRRAGFYRRGIEDKEAWRAEDVLTTLNLAGRYQEVLDLGSDDPEIMAKALTRLGRVREAVRLYPDHCQEAYLVQGRYRDLLDRWSEPSEYQVLALSALNETDALKHYPRDSHWLWSLAQFHVGPDHYLETVSPGQSRELQTALIWQALQRLSAGKPRSGRESLSLIPLVQSDTFWLWPDPYCMELILATITRGLVGDPDVAESELRCIVDQYKYTDWQKMWHDAAFLLGRIGVEEYRNQPCQSALAERLAIVQVLAIDRQDRASVSAYQALLKQVAGLPLLRRPQLRQFILWRLQALGG